MLGGVSISAAHVFIGSVDQNVYAFALPVTTPPPQVASIRVSSPNSGEEWLKGERYDINWAASASVSRVDVSISRDGGATWELLAGGLDASASTIKVKAKKPKSETVLVKVSDSANSAVFGESGMFYIR